MPPQKFLLDLEVGASFGGGGGHWDQDLPTAWGHPDVRDGSVGVDVEGGQEARPGVGDVVEKERP